MRRASSPALRARPVFWAMLLVAAFGSAGMKLLAWHARGQADPDWQIAVYRYSADALPGCEQLLGRNADSTALDVPEAVWARLQPSPLKPVETRAGNGRCQPSAPLAM